jgi:two-component system, NarL family, response regulator LiaR
MAILLFLLKWLELRFVVFDHLFEVYAAIISVIFMVLGAWLMHNFQQRKLEKENAKQEIIAIPELGLSQREMEVLVLMSQGFTNQQIADKLFLSIHTIKTHGSNLFVKLDVKNRTQALIRAKELEILDGKM